jgi:hypothetical protein
VDDDVGAAVALLQALGDRRRSVGVSDVGGDRGAAERLGVGPF